MNLMQTIKLTIAAVALFALAACGQSAPTISTPPAAVAVVTAQPAQVMAVDLPAVEAPTEAPAADVPAVDVQTDDASAPCKTGQFKGNDKSHIFHAPGQRDYAKTHASVTCFDTAEQAQAAGYRAAKR